jgi:membrane protein DedA with SNARE-associated domain
MMTAGYPGLVFIMVVENVFPPIPSEVVLPLAGFLAHSGNAGFTLPLVVLAGGLGSVIGALVLYWFGAWARRHGGRRVVLAAGRYVFLAESDLDAAEAMFARYQSLAVLTGRFVPIVRSVVSIPAGYNRMPLLPFIGLTALGTTIWCAILASAGWILGANWALVRTVLSQYERAVLVLCVIAFVAFVGWRLRRRLLTGEPGPAGPAARRGRGSGESGSRADRKHP